VQTPLLDIVEARAQRVDMIALSFSVAMNPRQALDGLAELHTGWWPCRAVGRRQQPALKRRRPPLCGCLSWPIWPARLPTGASATR
jgi:hypothetical protein